jgi:hypothetical protein
LSIINKVLKAPVAVPQLGATSAVASDSENIRLFEGVGSGLGQPFGVMNQPLAQNPDRLRIMDVGTGVGKLIKNLLEHHQTMLIIKWS